MENFWLKQNKLKQTEKTSKHGWVSILSSSGYIVQMNDKYEKPQCRIKTIASSNNKLELRDEFHEPLTNLFKNMKDTIGEEIHISVNNDFAISEDELRDMLK